MRWIVLLAVLVATPAFAQEETNTPEPTATPPSTPTITSTPTVTSTPTITPTLTPAVVGTPKQWRARGDRGPVTAVLLDGATALNASGGVVLDAAAPWSVQVTVGTCTSYTLKIEASLDCVSWFEAASIANTDIGANTTGVSVLQTRPVRCARARLSAVSDCTVSAVLFGGP